MKRNEGGLDRGVRIVLGIALIVLGLTGVFGGALAVVGYILGGLLVVTGAVGFCLAYAILGISTRKPDVSGPAHGAARP